MSTVSEEIIQVKRVTRFIPKPFEEVLSKLKSSINQNSAGQGLGILNHLESKAAFEDAIHSSLGPHSFMQFQEINHSPWLKLYQQDVKGALRIVFGNPLIAVTMLKHDKTAGLFVPVEALILEREDGSGTDVVQIQPSSLIASHNAASKELKAAAQELDEKLTHLWEFVAA